MSSLVIAKVLILVGVLFDLFGAVGLVRLPDVYNRVQAATKCVTLGTCMILLGTFFWAGIGALGVKALICAGFVLLTSPVGAHAIARGAYISGVLPWEGTIIDLYRDHAVQNTSSERAETEGVSSDAKTETP